MPLISSDSTLLPDVKLVNNYVSLLEFIAGQMSTDCNLSLMGSAFYTQLLAVQAEIRELRNVYVNSLKFQSYE